MKEIPATHIDEDTLKFIGKINASISHELKNIFAIISETTGFLNDLTQLAKKGDSFDLAVLENCNNSISEEIDRGFHTIRQMNKFAHTVDEPVMNIDLSESVELALQLTRFLSYTTPTHVVYPKQKILVRTNPFLLQVMIYRIFCRLYETGKTSRLSVRIDKAEDQSARLIFSGVDFDSHNPFSSSEIKNTAVLLGIDAMVTENASKFEIIIPELPG